MKGLFMNNATFDGDRPNVALLSAMSARYTITELYLACETGSVITVYWYPEGKSRPARVWKGVPDKAALSVIRRLVGIARGISDPQSRNLEQAPRWATVSRCAAAAEHRDNMKQLVGQLRDGFERCITYKWTTDGTTRRKLPPETLVWRDTYSGKVYVRHPEDEARAM